MNCGKLASPLSDGADGPAPAPQNLGVGLLATALAHLQARKLARKNILEAGSTRAKKAAAEGGGAETLSQQVINNSAAVQQER